MEPLRESDSGISMSKGISRVSAEEARHVHSVEVGGSSPSPATRFLASEENAKNVDLC